eukprot:746755-Hanusia_phi.AAC.5
MMVRSCRALPGHVTVSLDILLLVFFHLAALPLSDDMAFAMAPGVHACLRLTKASDRTAFPAASDKAGKAAQITSITLIDYVG